MKTMYKCLGNLPTDVRTSSIVHVIIVFAERFFVIFVDVTVTVNLAIVETITAGDRNAREIMCRQLGTDVSDVILVWTVCRSLIAPESEKSRY